MYDTNNEYTPLREKYIKQLKDMSCSFEDNSGKFFAGGYCYRVHFTNGYGVSIVKHDGTYGHGGNKWEIAVLKGNELCYTTPVTNDVIGWLTAPEVMEYVKQVAELPAE